MANLKDSPKFAVHNDYYTPKSAWERINHLIPKDKVIWEACMLNSNLSKSPEYLTELKNKVIYNTEWDIFKLTAKCDMIITNPPFETDLKKKVLKRLVELDKPFIIIMNSMNTFANYFTEILNPEFIQIITPRSKINFDKLVDNKIVKTKNCSFYCVYVAYKMNLKNENLFV
jgi:hypothetical protein